MTSSEDSGEVLPLTESAKCNLSAAEAYEYLTKAGNVYKKLTCLSPNPPVQPRGGSIFLYDLGPEKSKWEANKKKIRYFVCVSYLNCVTMMILLVYVWIITTMHYYKGGLS